MRQRKTYYQDSRFLITSIQARAPWKTYRVSRIEKVSIRRDPLYFWIIIAALFIGFEIKFDLLQHWMHAAYIGGFVALAAIASEIGVLMVTTKTLSEVAFIGRLTTIKNVRRAIEQALHDHDAGDAAFAPDDESSED